MPPVGAISAPAALPRRKTLRLSSYDYAQPGAYYVTLCAQRRACIFGRVVDGQMRLNEYGESVTACWLDLPGHYDHVRLDAFVVMPNHVHAVIGLRGNDDTAVDQTHDNTVGAGLRPAPTVADDAATKTNAVAPKRHALPEIVRAFKSFSARHINEIRNSPGAPVWQRTYYEHVVRSESELGRIRAYVRDNPARWTSDAYFTLDVPRP